MKIKDIEVNKHIMSFKLGNNPVPSIGEYATIELEDGDTLDIVVNEVGYAGGDIVVYFGYDRRQEEFEEERQFWNTEFNSYEMFEGGVDYDY